MAVGLGRPAAGRVRGGAVRRAIASGLAVLALAAGLVASPALAQDPPTDSISWQSAGDSYSAGEGVSGNLGDCAQSEKAYGPTAVGLLESARWSFDSVTFTACTGRLVEDYFSGTPGPGEELSLWGWGLEQGGPDRVDAMAMSFGGNDIGFADVLFDCLPLPDSWQAFLTTGAISGLSGCDTSEDDLTDRVEWLLNPTAQCSGYRQPTADPSRDEFNCDLNLGTKRGSIADFYKLIIDDHLTQTGRLYVVSYFSLFAPPEQWPGYIKIACQGITRGDTEKLGRVAFRLNDMLQAAVDRANEGPGEDRVVFVDRFSIYAEGQHELCGTGEDWLNGIATDRGDGTFRTETSFHPNGVGHWNTAAELARTVDETFPRQSAPLPVADPSCPPPVQDTDPFYIYAAMCLDGWAVALQAGCTNGRSSGVAFRAEAERWVQVEPYVSFDGWPPPQVQLEAIGMPSDLAAEFSRAPDRPAGSGCENFVVNQDGGIEPDPQSLTSFSSPSGNVGCIITTTSARCDIQNRSWEAPPQPTSCRLDWGAAVAVGASDSGFICHGDSVLGSSTALIYGDSARNGSFVCSSEESGMTCRNEKTGNGFFVSQQSYDLF